MRREKFNEFATRLLPNEIFDENFILDWREKMGLTQNEAAEMLQISLAAYGHYERGKKPNNQKVYIPHSILLACVYLNNERLKHDR